MVSFLDVVAGPIFFGGSILFLIAAIVILMITTAVLMLIWLKRYLDEKRKSAKSEDTQEK